MVQHRGVRARRVARQDRAHDGVVFLIGPQQAAFHPELGAAERSDPTAQAAREFGDRLVVRAGIDRQMERDVGIGIGVGIAGLGERQHRLLTGLQAAAFDRRHAHGREPRAGRFHLGHRDEQVLDLLGRRRRDHRALARAHVDQPAGRELPQRLAHRRARHAVLLRQADLVEPDAGLQRAVEDAVGDGAGELFGEGRIVGAHARHCIQNRCQSQ